MNLHHNAEGFKGPSVVSQRFWNIDEAKKILSFVGVNPKAEDFFPRDSSWMKKEALAYIISVNLQKIAEISREFGLFLNNSIFKPIFW